MSDKASKQHEAIERLKAMAVELGHTPSKQEYISKWPDQCSSLFGGYTPFVHAAGLIPKRDQPKKIDNSVFERDIEQHLESYEPREVIDRGPYPSLAVISDIHWPFCSDRVINRFQEFVGDVKPEWVIINGDAWDMFSQSRFPRSHNIFTPREERDAALRANNDFWSVVKKNAPEARCIQMLGNHDVRPMKRVLETYPAAEDWITEALTRDFSFPGVKTIMDPREELFLREDIIIFHGYRAGLGAHRDYTLMNCINGHTHQGGVVYKRIRGETIWELNSGLAGDPEAKGLTYTPQKIVTWTPGFAALTKYGPIFIPV